MANYSANKDDINEILNLARYSTPLMDFLKSVLVRDIESNVFSEIDGYQRGIRDGKAEEAFKILQLLEGISYDK